MSDWFSTAVEMQREILQAQQAQIEAVQKLLDAGRTATDLQQAGRTAVDAQVKAWSAWMKLGGWGR